MGDTHEGHLGAVYAAKSVDEVAAGYDAWSDSYEDEMRSAGYRHPAICVALLARHLPKGGRPVLDAGCGTGLAGEWLGLLGWPEVEGLDISTGMLARAAEKGVYQRLTQAALGQPLPWADNHFSGVISTGVFTTGHVGAEGLPELLRITRPNGTIVLTVKLPLWEGPEGIHTWFQKTYEAGKGRLAEVTAPYISMPGDPATVPSLACVFRKA